MTVDDATIWREIKTMESMTDWPPSAIKDAVAMKLEVPLERVTRVWRERIANFG